jgi:hypothetical protein
MITTTPAPGTQDIHEAIYHALPTGWQSQQEVRDVIRGIAIGAVTFTDASDSIVDMYIGHLVDLGMLNWRSEYRTERMGTEEAEAWRKFQREVKHNWTDSAAEKRFVVFHYQKKPLSEVPLIEERRRAVEQAREAAKAHNDAEDAKLLAAAKRLGFVRAEDTPSTTTQEA